MLKIIAILSVILLLAGCGSDKPEESTSGDFTEEKVIVDISSEIIDQIIVPFNKGVALMDQFRPSDAVKAFEGVVRIAPYWITGRLNLGIALLNAQSVEDNYERAEKEFRWVISKTNNNPYAYYALGMLLRHLTQFEEAKLQFEKVLDIDPEDADTHYQLGLLEEDQLAAREHFEKTLKMIPHHEAACYRLQKLLLEAGEKKQAQKQLQRFRALKTAGVGVFYGMKYGQMGRYAEIVRAFKMPTETFVPSVVPLYKDIAQEAGLTITADGVADWPGVSSTNKQASAFGPGIAIEDLEGDGSLSLYITAVGSGGEGALYQYQKETSSFLQAQNTGIDGVKAIGAYFGDYDADGDPDLYLTCVGPNRLYRNDGNAHFTDVTEVTGTAGGDFLSVGAAWADADHDGDLDIYVANFSSLTKNGAPNVLWRNNGDGSFSEVAVSSGIDGGNASSVSVVFMDIDDDRDLDIYLINYDSPNRIFLNDRVSQYTDATSLFPELADDGPGLGALVGDLDLNGKEDILLLRGPKSSRLFLQTKRGHFIEDFVFGSMVQNLGGAAGGMLGDVDLDGDLDLILLGEENNILMNSGGHFDSAVAFGKERKVPDSRGAVATDLDGDGSLELIITRIGVRPELWHSSTSEDLHWLEIVPVKDGQGLSFGVEPTSEGLHVEVKSGRILQVASVSGSSGYLSGPPRRLHFGLGKHAKADYVRLSWSDAVFQSELEVAADQLWRVPKVKRKASSCPILFSWNGERFTYVTDFLGGGGVGFFVSPGVYAPPDPTEDIRIPPALIKSNNGRYVLRVAEPLEEVTYLDQLYLKIYDHPGNWEVYPDERFGGSVVATGRPLAVAEKIFPRSAINDRGENVLDCIRESDRVYVEPPKDPRFMGYAADHWIELDFGDSLKKLKRPLFLYLYGWVEYTYSHVNYATYQAGIKMRSPFIEVPNEKGGWYVALADMGYPAGLPRMMTLDISSLPIKESGRLRIRSNMEIFWDQIFVGENISGDKLNVSTLQPVTAELRFLGYPREYSPDGEDPTLYDYHRVDQGVPFKNMTGDFTVFGDTRDLLKSVDDRFVIMARGEEIALEFDATKLPGLPQGWKRTIFLHTDGYCKDMDLYTAFPNTVKPLPYHKMKNYPPELPVSNMEEYQSLRNTRRIVGHE